MRKSLPDWLNYWNEWEDLSALLKVRDNIDDVYDELRDSIGRALMSEEMLELQESLEKRIDDLTELEKREEKIAA